MTTCLRSLLLICLASLLIACTTGGSSSSIVKVTPALQQATVEQILQQAESSKTPELAASLRLYAAEKALQQQKAEQAVEILKQVPVDQLTPAQQIFAKTLTAEIALAQRQPETAVKQFSHPSFQRLSSMPLEQQNKSRLVLARAYQANGQTLDAARERVTLAPQLSQQEAQDNTNAIWELVSGLTGQQATGNTDLDGWIELAGITRNSATLQQQQSAVDSWLLMNPGHPAAKQLPAALSGLKDLSSQTLDKIALLLPESGQLAPSAKAIRDGMLAAHYQAQQSGQSVPQISFYDSDRISSLDSFYQQAQSEGVQLVIGPLDKAMVRQLSSRSQLPITTLALNYSESGTPPAQLFQFGLAVEDEAREVARRAWNDGMRRAVAMVPQGDWGDRALNAFKQEWESLGGTVVTSERIAEPIQLAQQIARIFRLRQSEERAQNLQDTLGTTVDSQPSRGRNIDFLFLASTPQQAQQIRPTMVFQYAGDVPVYATSHLYAGNAHQSQYQDLDGIRFCETPWLLDNSNPLRKQVAEQWPQANGSIGRLYAMGIDAYNLAPNLSQLKALPAMRIQGLTGSLGLTKTQRVERSNLPWAEFSNGQVKTLSEAPLTQW